MELDTGATVYIIGEKEAQEMFPNKAQEIRGDSENIHFREDKSCRRDWRKCSVHESLVLVVVSGNEPNVFGRNWVEAFNLNWNQIAHTLAEQDKYLNTLLTKYADVFTNILGNMTQHQAKMYIKAGTTSKFYKAHPVPFALQQQIEKKLNPLESLGIYNRICLS